MGHLVIVIVVLGLGLAYSLQKTWREVRSLRDRSATELAQLHSYLAGRHLIVSHLSDSLPESFDGHFDREQLVQAREQAERALHAIDPAWPIASEVRVFAGHEQDLLQWIENLTGKIEEVESVRDIQPVSGCLAGLKESNKKIDVAISTYNAAAITYNTYLERPVASLLSRFSLSGEFGVIDLSPKVSVVLRRDPGL